MFFTLVSHKHTHTYTHAATRSHTHTRIRIRKRDWKCMCVILLLGQLEATFLGNCQLPQFQLRLIGLRLRPQLNLLTKLRETHREIERERGRTPLRGDSNLSDLLLPEQQLGALPPPPTLAHSLAIILSRPLALSLSISLIIG